MTSVNLKDMLDLYYGPIMTALIILAGILMIAAIREYVNFITIEENIAYQQQEQEYRIEKTNFQQNFAIPYLQSDSAVFFHKHENNILLYDEYVVKFTSLQQEKDIVDEDEIIEEISEGVVDNQQKWKTYFESLFSTLD